MKFDIITIFSNLFDGFLTESLILRGQKKGMLKINIHNLRKWTTDKHKTVDDRPFGGGPGMVLKIEPIFKAVMALKSEIRNPKSQKIPNSKSKKNSKLQTTNYKLRTILFSPRGKNFTQKDAKRLAKYDQLILVCGRYEGVDERVAKYVADEVISIGDFVLNGGEVAAMAVIEAVSRMVPGFIAKSESALKPDFPQYTRPEEFKSQIPNPKSQKIKNSKIKNRVWRVPRVLLSGDHKQIEEWRKKRTKT